MRDRTISDSVGLCVSALDAAIAHGPDAPHEEIAEAVRCVIGLRNHVIDLKRQGQLEQDHVDRVNALVSLAHGAEHPLIGFHLHRLEQTRDGVKELGQALAAADAKNR